MACAPYPTSKPHKNLPRYLTNIKQIDCEIASAEKEKKTRNYVFQNYFEGIQFKILDKMST